jgi:hypothetical protein
LSLPSAPLLTFERRGRRGQRRGRALWRGSWSGAGRVSCRFRCVRSCGGLPPRPPPNPFGPETARPSTPPSYCRLSLSLRSCGHPILPRHSNPNHLRHQLRSERGSAPPERLRWPGGTRTLRSPRRASGGVSRHWQPSSRTSRLTYIVRSKAAYRVLLVPGSASAPTSAGCSGRTVPFVPRRSRPPTAGNGRCRGAHRRARSRAAKPR